VLQIIGFNALVKKIVVDVYAMQNEGARRVGNKGKFTVSDERIMK
jgi:hypothetical protein